MCTCVNSNTVFCDNDIIDNENVPSLSDKVETGDTATE